MLCVFCRNCKYIHTPGIKILYIDIDISSLSYVCIVFGSRVYFSYVCIVFGSRVYFSTPTMLNYLCINHGDQRVFFHLKSS